MNRRYFLLSEKGTPKQWLSTLDGVNGGIANACAFDAATGDITKAAGVTPGYDARYWVTQSYAGMTVSEMSQREFADGLAGAVIAKAG